MSINRLAASALTGLLIAAASACSSSDAATGPNTKSVSLSFSTKPSSGPAIAGGRQVGRFTQGSGSDVLIITKAQIVLAKIELATAGGANCTAEDNGSSECEELKGDASLVDLPVDQSVVTSLNAPVPAGTYTSFEAKVRLVRSTDAGGAAFIAAHPEFSGATVRVEGTFNGTPFVYTGSAEAELELAFAPPLVVDSTGMNITVNVDLASWFVTGSGSLVDPATANAGGPNASLVDHNIHQSFEAFEDENHDGHDDSQS
jgi:hypothetical protein